MKTKFIALIISFSFLNCLSAQTNDVMPQKYLQVGVGFGEIPFLSKSFKPSFTVGYRFNQYVYVGAIYQLVDNIERNNNSYDAQSIGFEGLVSSKEKVGQRALIHMRVTPVKHGPFISLGIVMNADDVETIDFDSRKRMIGNNYYEGNTTITLTRKGAIRPALGLGYEYIFNNNFGLNAEWTFNIFNPVPSKIIELQTDYEILESDTRCFKENLTNELGSNFHNRYHIFHIGVTYNF